MRAIDADALLKKDEWLTWDGDSYNVVHVVDVLCAPTLDVEPVRHARWYRGQCTNCKTINPAYKKDWNGDYVFKETPYCPECGAKMDLPS